ncbi:hypothetical protein [Nitrospirillum sp. BR 11163]|uniref:hypothetical protein n=1 Tax=Nitrospirillum sp. BR 11163 TaxID=3104323 RepID=UPI002AFF2AC2|nr:hypothetical protein [Nitrospirillum sp. BR 11163]MEA1674080.1 hypothetical protein [Nitrospirillum sp. BR 11163]
MTAPVAPANDDAGPRTAFATLRHVVSRALTPESWGGAIFLATAVTALYVAALLVFSIAMGVIHGHGQ